MPSTYEIPSDWTEPEGLHDLLESLRESRPTADMAKIRYAYWTAEQAHAGQTRASGLAYIVHPLAVA
ncbi:hypothetical protein EON77_13820, partial [bacterium]